MKRITFVAALAALLMLPAGAGAQMKQYDYDLSYFNGIVISGEFDVTLEEGADNHVKLTVDEPLKDFVTCSVKGHTLTINYDERSVPKDVKKLYKGKDASKPMFRAVVTSNASLEQITLEDKAILDCTMHMDSESFKVNVSDNAVLKGVNAKCQFATVTVDKKSESTIIIEADNLSLTVSGNASIAATQTSKTTDLNISGFTNLTMHGEMDNLNVNAKGNAKVALSGKATTCNYVITGGCNINASELEAEDAAVKMNSVCTLSEAATNNLNVNLQGGATLIFSNEPSITVDEIKASNMRRYASSKK